MMVIIVLEVWLPLEKLEGNHLENENTKEIKY